MLRLNDYQEIIIRFRKRMHEKASYCPESEVPGIQSAMTELAKMEAEVLLREEIMDERV